MIASNIASSQIAGSYGVDPGNTIGQVLNLANPLGAILTGVNQVASLFGLNSSDPARDQERINRINLAFDLAIRGDERPQTTTNPNTNLNGASGREYLEYIATNNHDNPRNPGPGTSAAVSDGAPVYGSQIAYRYAQMKFTEYKARVAAGTIGVALASESDIPAKISQVVTGSIIPALLVVAAIVAVVIVMRKGR